MNFLRRPTTLLPSDAMRFQAMADNAPVGSVGASGGLLAPKPTKKSNALSGLLAAGSMVPGVGDAVGLLGDAAMYASDPSSRTWPNALMTGLGALPFVPSAQQLAELAGPLSAMVVYHGSPHKFDAFDMSKIGTGEGAQAYGHGLYLAENPEVAKEYMKVSPSVIPPTRRAFMGKELDAGTWEYKAASLVDEMGLARARQLVSGWLKGARPGEDVAGYQKTLETLNAASSRKDFAKLKNQSNLYTVDLPDEAIAKMLDWDKPLSEQAPEVRNTLRSLVDDVASSPNAARASRDISRAFNPYSRADLLEEISKRYGWKIDGNNLVKPDGTVIPESAIEAQLKMRQRGKVYDSAGDLYRDLAQAQGSDAAISAALRNNGIPGIRYLDGGSRATNVSDAKLLSLLEKHKGDKTAAIDEFMRGVYDTPKAKEAMRNSLMANFRPPTSNFVVFDDKLPKILKRE